MLLVLTRLRYSLFTDIAVLWLKRDLQFSEQIRPVNVGEKY